MTFKKNSGFEYSFRGINRIVEEKGNVFLRLAQLAWVGKDEKVESDKIHLDLRKYTVDSDGKEKMLKGVSFMTEQGPNELVHIMVDEGFGDTNTILNSLKNRKDFPNSLDTENDNNTYDLHSMF